MVVHHGGAGTTAAAVAAGRPQVICPFVADQPFWGRRMAHLGVAPPPISQRRLTAVKLAEAIDQAAGFASEAAELGSRVRAERGTRSRAAAGGVIRLYVRAGRRGGCHRQVALPSAAMLLRHRAAGISGSW
ncbi:nucleotide disphospho-sugar-binding domain-containing protein [Amycolatopsis sp. NPDC058278]|uniref:nucleotide disphospho-sugar-binding domain-containing protein n=1 Tax=Amycolatopsis sp. NPDC058278 TaxID=3346417 RepID=UPI0036DB2680